MVTWTKHERWLRTGAGTQHLNFDNRRNDPSVIPRVKAWQTLKRGGAWF